MGKELIHIFILFISIYLPCNGFGQDHTDNAEPTSDYVINPRPVNWPERFWHNLVSQIDNSAYSLGQVLFENIREVNFNVSRPPLYHIDALWSLFLIA